jgi:hypothetical protein
MLYRPDIGIHGRLSFSPQMSELEREPSLTLCALDHFGFWGGPLSQRAFREIAETSAFQRIAARADSDHKVSIRVSSYTVWLDASEVPSARPDWHIDRVGALWRHGNSELVDLRDPFGFPSYILVSCFVTPYEDYTAGLDQVSTEFLLDSFLGSSPDLWADMNDMHRDIDTAVSRGPNLLLVKAGDRMIVSFSPRTVHRPGHSAVGGWRYLLRVGLYTGEEDCSPYSDHFVFYNPAWDMNTQSVKFRRVGNMNPSGELARRSVSLLQNEGLMLAKEFVEQNNLCIAGDAGIASVIQAVTSAGLRGIHQLAPV